MQEQLTEFNLNHQSITEMLNQSCFVKYILQLQEPQSTTQFKILNHVFVLTILPSDLCKVSPILLLSWISDVVTLQSGQLEHSDSLSQGTIADVHGFTVHALGNNLGKYRTFTNGPLHKGCRVQGNTPDFHA